MEKRVLMKNSVYCHTGEVMKPDGAPADAAAGGGAGEADRAAHTVTTVEGGRVELPCDIKAPTPGDSVYLVLWYRKDSGTPIYRYILLRARGSICFHSRPAIFHVV